ncbi:hypothetical protein FOA52_002095 [Chlamydomonas sp. UWO 241]|nr:hypothetical protein FOA52_002095 [Chlamydomonas sp. UWO 241]
MHPQETPPAAPGLARAKTPVPTPPSLRGAPVNFKDLNLSTEDLEEEMDVDGASGGMMRRSQLHYGSFSADISDGAINANAGQLQYASGSGEKPNVGGSGGGNPAMAKLRRIGRTKQVIIMVGLPGRGKTFLCNKLKRYLNWLGHDTLHINVGSYRRKQKPEGETQSADFFDARNPHGIDLRHQAVQAALVDLDAYLASDEGQVVVFDATNSTEERRRQLVRHFHGRYQYLFIESICNDPHTLEQYYLLKMKHSPDYEGTSVETALADFHRRVAKYEDVYETLEDRSVHYIKLIDMVTGRGYMDVNRISGYIPGKIVFFLMQICKAGMAQLRNICKAGMAQSRKIWLTRHGESEFNRAGLIGGDSGLSPAGQEYAQRLPHFLIDRLPLTGNEQPAPLSVWTSTLKRTIQTANYLPFPKLRWKALDEIHAGSCDGYTYAEIEERFPEEFKARSNDKLRYRAGVSANLPALLAACTLAEDWRKMLQFLAMADTMINAWKEAVDGGRYNKTYPAGESYMDVIQRLEPVVIEMERQRECVCVVGHQAVLRAILGYFTNTPLEDIPNAGVPLHTLIELRPRQDGSMEVEMVPVEMMLSVECHGGHTSTAAHATASTSASAAAAAAAAAADGSAGLGAGGSAASAASLMISGGAVAASTSARSDSASAGGGVAGGACGVESAGVNRGCSVGLLGLQVATHASLPRSTSPLPRRSLAGSSISPLMSPLMGSSPVMASLESSYVSRRVQSQLSIVDLAPHSRLSLDKERDASERAGSHSRVG